MGPLRRAHRGAVILRVEVKRLLVLGGIATSLVAAAASVQAARTPPPALLTYALSAQAGGICLARADGTRRLRLTRGVDSGPSWSPRGVYVAFARQASPSQSSIAVADARGRVLRQFGTGLSTRPAWSPNGRWIAYSAGTSIVVATTTGRTVTEIQSRYLYGGPVWSRDSRRIAFAEVRELDIGSLRTVQVVNADGTGRRVLLGNATDLAWSPNGSRIAYVSYPSRLTDTGHVYVVNADGSGNRKLTRSQEFESQPAWSPSGRQIALTRGTNVVVALSNGTGERVAVRGARDPAWRPHFALPAARRAACS
jgi:Tol biopolymer transport system component